MQAKVVKFSAFHDKTFSARSKPAAVQQKTTTELLEGGYLLIGYIDLRRNIRTCYEDGGCVNHDSKLPPPDELQNEAAQRGGDVVTVLEERTVIERNDRSVCAQMSTYTSYINNVPYVNTICVRYATIVGKLEARINRALIWRHEPEAARSEANARAIEAAFTAMESAQKEDEKTAARSAMSKPAAPWGGKDQAEEIKNDPLSRSIYLAITNNDTRALGELHRSGKLQEWSDGRQRSALMVAIAMDNAAAVRSLLAFDKGLSRRDAYGLSAMDYAVVRGNLALVKELVAAGYDPKAKSFHGGSALFFGVMNPHDEVFDWLLQQGLDPKERTAQKETLVIYAAEAGEVKRLQRLQGLGLALDERDTRGRSPLMVAALNAKRDAAMFLLQQGASVTHKDDGGNSVLHYAASGGESAVMQALLDRGADLNAENTKGGNAFIVAVVAGKQDAAALLMDRGSRLTTSQVSPEAAGGLLVASDSASLLKRYLDAFPDLKQLLRRDPDWIHYAAKSSGADTIRTLVDLGARVEAPDHLGATPLQTAVLAGNERTVRALLEARANARVRDQRGQTLLRVATMQGHAKVVEVLREYGVTE